MDRLTQFFGQDPNRQQQLQQFQQQYQQDPSQLDPRQTAQMYRQMANQLDPQDLDEAHQQALSQVPEQDRRQMAQQFQQWTQDPNNPYQGYPQGLDLNQAAQPQQLGRMMSQAGQQSPDLLEQLAGPNSPINSTGAKLAMAGAAAFLASKYLGNR